ncbi:verrucotoxin subunit beta-like isoform X1 [Misgurnus anguillicaudatus]|uniref:verrucotoxin subunit beta-like isoform X1 n=1 Tax=Misgurnus anguillicaudatus TaxID=75329 RepID=UPI003CCF6113
MSPLNLKMKVTTSCCTTLTGCSHLFSSSATVDEVFNMESEGVIEVAALGRPFQLGMLYDCRKDALVPGITLWNEEKLKLSIRSHDQINTDFKVTASDSIEEKSNLLNIEASMKLSLLGGLINVTGAAKYLNDTKKSFIQQRLTLHYHSTTRFEELSMNHLASENIAHHEVFDHDTATHVVTAVLYGADACFVFDREVSSDEDKTAVEGEVEVALEKLKKLSVDVNVKAKLSMDDAQKNAGQNFTVTFYGDFQLPSNPTSFEDALKVYAELPKLLGEDYNLVVPLRVWLYPLSKLNSRASKLLKEISIDLISKTASALESLNTTEMKCSDLLKDSPASALTSFHDKILQMKQNCYKYKLSLMKKLGSLLPQIRGDKIEDSALIDLLKDHHESPFRESELAEWLKAREEESEIIKTLLRQLIDSGAKVENNLRAILMDLDVENLVSYTFTSLDWSDVLLPKQMTYLEPSTMRNKNDLDSKKETSWLTDAIHKTMRSNLEMFKNLIDSKDHKPVKFIVSSKQMDDHPGSCILLYEGGCVETFCFTPPSQPARPITEEVKGDSVIIYVKPSTCPATEELKLLYKINQEKIWTSQPVLKDQNTVTLTDLRPGTEYEIKCAAVGKLNFTTESDVIIVKTEGSIRPFMGYCGLINPGWTSCWNTLLQTLYMTKEYRDHVMRLNTGGGSTEDKFIKELKMLFENLGKRQGPVSTKSTQETADEIFKRLRFYRKSSLWFRKCRDEDDYPAECLWKILQVTRSSEIFMFDENRDTRCQSCNTVSITGIISVTFEEFQDVEDALQIRKGFIQQFCSDCNKPLRTKHEIHSQKILIVRLRRFKEGRVEKNELEVIIRPHLKISSHEFELYAIINYYGSKQSGHYNVDIKCENEQWYRFDEIQVCESFLNNISQRNENFVYRSSSAYMLFYRPNKHNS